MPLTVFPVTYALGKKVSISSVPGNKGIQGAVFPVPIKVDVALAAALAAVFANPKNTVMVPALINRY
jgi:hypothetical protein